MLQQTKINQYFSNKTIFSDKHTTIERKTKVNKWLRKCAQKRWSGLISRIGKSNHMMTFLGPRLWGKFKTYCKENFYATFIRRFRLGKGRLKCCGPIDNIKCPERYRISLKNQNYADKMSKLHLDHEVDLVLVCDTWRKLLALAPTTWHENVQLHNLCDLLVGENLKFRCCVPSKTPREQCHRTDIPHYNTSHRINALSLPS